MLPIIALLLAPVVALNVDPVETVWGGPADIAYDTGFVENVRIHQYGGVCLFDMDLIENDAPGAGASEKGIWWDVVWGPNQARKVLQLDDARARKAYVVVFSEGGYKRAPSPHPLTFEVNGHTGRITKDNHETYRWVEFPPDVLRTGDNTITFSCPEAAREAEGWSLYLSRADEFAAGGGDPTHVGETSFKSADGGATWAQSPFGPDGNTRAEYTVRLSLDRHLASGTLETPVIEAVARRRHQVHRAHAGTGGYPYRGGSGCAARHRDHVFRFEREPRAVLSATVGNPTNPWARGPRSTRPSTAYRSTAGTPRSRSNSPPPTPS